MQALPRPMAAAFIIREGKLLLVENIKHGLRIEPPGGKVHDGETHEEACIREVKEELGVTVTPTEHFSSHVIDTPEGRFAVELFLCTITEGEPRGDLEPGKIGGCGWYGYDDLQKLAREGTLVPDVCEALPRLERHMKDTAQ